MASRISTISVIPSTDNTWAVTPASDKDDLVFFDDKSYAETIAKINAILRNSKVVVYSTQRQIESITELADLFKQSNLEDHIEAITKTLKERVSAYRDTLERLIEQLEYRIHVYATENHWEVSTFKNPIESQFVSKAEAVKYAYQQAVEHGYIVYIYDADGQITETIDPEDDLELSDATKRALQAVRDGTADYITLDDLITELGLENDIHPQS